MEAQEGNFTVRVVCYRRHNDSSDVDVLMVHNLARGQKPSAWGLPGGRARKGENLQVAAARELFEEAGVKVSPEELKKISSSFSGGSGTHQNVLFGIVIYDPAMGEITSSNDPDATVDNVKWVPSTELFEEYSSIRNEAIRRPLHENDYYPSHIIAICEL